MLRCRGVIIWGLLFLSVVLVVQVLAGTEAKSTPAAAAPVMTKIDGLILGIIEGVTEYLPISSTGHLILGQRLMGLGGQGDQHRNSLESYAICIQAGAIVAVLLLYFRRVRSVVSGLLGRDPQGKALAVNLVVAFMPAVVVGVLFEKQVKSHLFGLWPIVMAWLVGGVLILAIGRRLHHRPSTLRGELENLTVRRALVIGLIQCLAMWPGTSRSLVTILGGVVVGLSLPAAVEFSFLLGFITLSAATGYEFFKEGAAIVTDFGWVAPILGFVSSFVSAVLAIKWMVVYLQRHSLAIFGYYRIGLGILVAILLWVKYLTP